MTTLAILISLVAAVNPPLKLEKNAVPRLLGYQVLQVTDEATIVLNGSTARVSLLGVQAPDGIAPKAFQYLTARVLRDILDDETVFLGSDTEPVGMTVVRGPVYVYRASDGLLVNLEVIRRGFGKAPTGKGQGFQLRKPFQDEEQKARQARVGLWAPGSTEEYTKFVIERQEREAEVVEGVRAKKRQRAEAIAQRELYLATHCRQCGSALNGESGRLCSSCGSKEHEAREKRLREELKNEK